MPGKKRVEFAADVTRQDVELFTRLRKAVGEKRERERVARDAENARLEREKYSRKRAELLDACPDPALLAQHFEPEYVITPAVEAVANALTDTVGAYSGRLVVAVPPQELKSTLLRWLMFWSLLQNPDRRIVFASYASSLARQSGRIVRSYIETYGGEYGLRLDQAHRDASDFQVDQRAGTIFCTGVGGSLTGKPADCLIIDDPTRNQQDADSPTIRENLMEWWSAVARTRLAPGAPVIVVQTRWALSDLAGTLIDEGWPLINIPALADGVTPDALNRPVGEYLESTRGRTASDWQAIEAEVGPRTWNALFQQRPTPVEGGVFKQAWFDDHRVSPGAEPQMREIVVGVDPAETGTGDEAGIIVAGKSLNDQLWILDDVSGLYTQAAWGRATCLAWMRWKANRVVVESNLGMKGTMSDSWRLLRRQAVAIVGYGVDGARDVLLDGGDEAAANMEQLLEVEPYAEDIVDAGANGPREVYMTPRQSKLIRVESSTYPFEQGRAHLVGRFAKLEHQAVTFNSSTRDSPDRVDCLALVVQHLSRGGRSSIIV